MVRPVTVEAMPPSIMMPKSSSAQGAAVDPMEQLTGVERLIELVWAEDDRPCAKWVRQQTKLGAIPCVERGNRVWYIPKLVIEALRRPVVILSSAPKRRGRPPGSKNKLKLNLPEASTPVSG
jgi:hypothetical protein